MPALWVITVLMACVAAFYAVDTQMRAQSAPQQAAGAAIALCLVIIPYVFTRAVEGVVKAGWRDRVVSLLESANQNFKSGTDSMWKQLDAIRVTASAATVVEPASSHQEQPQRPPAPAEAEPSGMGYCMNCAKLRGYDVPKCVYCGSTGPVIGEAPTTAR